MITTYTAEQKAQIAKDRMVQLHKDIVTENYVIKFNSETQKWEWRTLVSNRLMNESKYKTALIVFCNKAETMIAETGNKPR